MAQYYIPIVGTPQIGDSGGGSGGGSSAYVVNIIEDEATGHYTCDKTAAEIFDAVQTTPVIFSEASGGFGRILNVVTSFHGMDEYSFICVTPSPTGMDAWVFSASTGSDYPTDGSGGD